VLDARPKYAGVAPIPKMHNNTTRTASRPQVQCRLTALASEKQLLEHHPAKISTYIAIVPAVSAPSNGAALAVISTRVDVLPCPISIHR
jgi:hypothetical protein